MKTLCFVALLLTCGQSIEVLENADFEGVFGSGNWECSGCTAVANADAYQGSQSLKVSGRNSFWNGPIQELTIGADVFIGVEYKFTGYIKLLNSATDQTVKVTLRYKPAGGANEYKTVVFKPNIDAADGWVEMQGTFVVEDKGPGAQLFIYAEGPDSGVDFLADAFSVTPIYNGLLKNGDFEYQFDGSWNCNSCTTSTSADAVSGRRSFKATGRTAFWQGPRQQLALGTEVIAGRMYRFTGYVKLPSGASHNFKVTLSYKKPDNTMAYQGIAESQNVSPSDGWTQLTGDFTVEDYGAGTELFLYVEGPNSGVDFLADNFALSDVTPQPTSQELLRNANFEDTFGNDNWRCNGCTGSANSDAYEGSQSLKASGRTSEWQGPLQVLPLGSNDGGKAYFFSGYVKVLNTVNAQKVTVTLSYKTTADERTYHGIASRDNVLPSDGWVRLESDFVMRSINSLDKISLYVSGLDSGVEFLVDKFSFIELSTAGWSQRAADSIDSIRKGDLTVTVTNSGSTSNNVEIKVEQLKHEFGFGTAVDSQTLKDNSNYRQWYLANFDWAVLENDFKWRQTEWNQGTYTWEKADYAMEILEQKEKKVRGHAIFWAAESRNPNWVQSITSPTALRTAVDNRVESLLGRYTGRLEHWDVNNEMINNDFFKDVYGSSQIRYDMFELAHQKDPNALLFLNDYNIIAGGHWLQNYTEQANEFKAAGAPVHGLGVQGHFSDKTPGAVLWNRFDRLATTGLPIWITELDYANSNVQKRADVLEEIITAAFSHPGVEGLLFWGFWENRHWRGPDAALVNGDAMTPNAAGLMWQNLFNQRWRTRETRSVGTLASGGAKSESMRAFYGDYRISVLVDGSEVHSENATLTKDAGSKEDDINHSMEVSKLLTSLKNIRFADLLPHFILTAAGYLGYRDINNKITAGRHHGVKLCLPKEMIAA